MPYVYGFTRSGGTAASGIVRKPDTIPKYVRYAVSRRQEAASGLFHGTVSDGD